MINILGFIKDLHYLKNARKVVNVWFEDYKQEKFNKIVNNLIEINKNLNRFEDFVEFTGEKDDYGCDSYFFCSRRNEAENLMYKRIEAKSGSLHDLEIHKIEVPWPIDSLWTLAMMTHGKMNKIRGRRIYWKAHRRTEKCDLCNDCDLFETIK